MNLPSDPFVLELLPEFIDDWLQKLDNEFPEIFANKDTDSLYRFAHTIKGSAYQFGFEELGDMGVEMMTQVKEEDWDNLELNKEKFRIKLVEIKEYLENNN